jgi:hypothetical protein
MKICKLLTFLPLLFLTGCGTLEIGIERKPPAPATVIVLPTASTLPPEQPSATAPVELPSPTAVYIPPTDTMVLPTETPVVPTEAPQSHRVQIYLIGLEDNGVSGQPVGCGDSAIPVEIETPPTQQVLRASLETLLSMKEQYYGESGLYNALYQSDLKVESISLENGKAEIYLTGTMMLGGECDNPRVEAQLEQTALQFSTVQEVSIYINGKLLSEVLSLRG